MRDVLSGGYRAADLVKVDWAAGDAAQVSEQDVLDYDAKQIAEPSGGALLVDDSGFDAAFRVGRWSTCARAWIRSPAGIKQISKASWKRPVTGYDLHTRKEHGHE